MPLLIILLYKRRIVIMNSVGGVNSSIMIEFTRHYLER